MSKRLVLLFFIFFWMLPIHSQQLIFENISEKLKLPSKECYNVMQDHNGYVWISTDAGLCKYDGYAVEIFDKNNGLAENSCYAVTEDQHGIIWIGTSAHRVFMYTNNQLVESPLTRIISDRLVALSGTLAQLQYIYSIKPLSTGKLYLSTQFYSFLADPLVPKLDNMLTKDSAFDLHFQKMDGQLLPVNRGNLGRVYNDKYANRQSIYLDVDLNDSNIHITAPLPEGFAPDWRILTAKSKNGDLFISHHTNFIHINKNNTYTNYTVANRIISLYCDKNNGLWVGTHKNGGYYYPDISTSGTPISILPEYSLSGVVEDHEEGIWCTTLEKGVFYCRNKNILSYQNIPGLDIRAEMLKSLDGKLYISSLPDKIWKFDENCMIQDQISVGKNYVVRDIFMDGETTYLMGPQFIKIVSKNGHGRFLQMGEGGLFASGLSIVKGSQDRLYVMNASRDLYMFKSISALPITSLFTPYKAITLFYSATEDRLLMGSKTGLYDVNQDDLSIKKNIAIDGQVLRIIRIKSGELCVLTKESGIYLYNEGNVIRMDQKLKLPATVFYDIIEDTMGHIWIGSNKGLIRITQNISPVVHLYDMSNGLPANIINNIAVHGNYIFLSTEEGISRFPVTLDLDNYAVPHISLSGFSINGVDTTYKEGMCLRYHQNSVVMSFHLPTFKDIGNPSFLYTLKGPEERVESIKGNKLVLNKLPPGNYSIEVYAVNNDGIKSKVPLILFFKITPPFWTTAWFIGLVSIIAILCIFLIVKIIIFRIKLREKRKTEIHRQIAEFRLHAIQAQMNPHFIFNAINSIQHYILSNDTQYAYDYLTKFSQLIRLVLNNSQFSTISLKKELEVLDIYIGLEQRRFKNKFSYVISLDPDVDPEEIKIPVMLLQPFVENAIWHGIMNLDEIEKGELSIHISLFDENVLKIVIRDNGVGRKKSQSLNRGKKYDSIGTLLSEKRLEVLENTTKQTQKIKIIDLYSDQEIALGTQVELYLTII